MTWVRGDGDVVAVRKVVNAGIVDVVKVAAMGERWLQGRVLVVLGKVTVTHRVQ